MSTTFWIQLLGIIFGAAMLYFTYVKYKRKELNKFELWIWLTGWVLLIILALIPHALDSIIGPLNFYRRLDFFVVFGFFVLLGLGFYNYSATKKMERKLDLFVRREALKKARKEENEKDIKKEPKVEGKEEN